MYVLSADGEVPVGDAEQRLIFCAVGEAELLFHDESIRLCKEDALLLNTAESLTVKHGDGAKVLVCDMKF